jgi:hypothetical protein
VRRFDLLVEAVRRAGAHKVLFGSDGPWLHPGVELCKVKALGLGPEARRQVLGGNLLRLIGGAAGQLGRRPPPVRVGRSGPGDPGDPGDPSPRHPLAAPRLDEPGDPWVGEAFVD